MIVLLDSTCRDSLMLIAGLGRLHPLFALQHQVVPAHHFPPPLQPEMHLQQAVIAAKQPLSFARPRVPPRSVTDPALRQLLADSREPSLRSRSHQAMASLARQYLDGFVRAASNRPLVAYHHLLPSCPSLDPCHPTIATAASGTVAAPSRDLDLLHRSYPYHPSARVAVSGRGYAGVSSPSSSHIAATPLPAPSGIVRW